MARGTSQFANKISELLTMNPAQYATLGKAAATKVYEPGDPNATLMGTAFSFGNQNYVFLVELEEGLCLAVKEGDIPPWTPVVVPYRFMLQP